jgi:hypothetical protein
MHIHFIRDDYNQAYRIWRSDSPGDMFDLLPYDQFSESIVKNIPVAVVIGDFPEDDEGNLICNLCRREREQQSKNRSARRHKKG